MAYHAPPTRRLATAAVILIAITGCSGNDTIESIDATTAPSSAPDTAPVTTVTETTAPTTPPATAPETTAPETTAPETTAAAPTTPPPTEATAPPTTAADAPATTVVDVTAADLTLASDGVTPFRFGDAGASVVAGLTGALGAPLLDQAQTYPDPADDGTFLDSSSEEGFVDPFGRTVCFANDLCAHFGGPAADSLTFTGWRLDGEGSPRLTTAAGVTVGSLLSDHLDHIDVGEGGCYTNGYGYTGGIDVGLWSSGEPFATFDADGNYVTSSPDPATVTVLTMTAGDVPYFLYEDC